MSFITHKQDIAFQNRDWSAWMSKGQQYLTNIQTEAADRLRKLSIPTTRHEDWRFTNLAALAEIDFAPAEHDEKRIDQTLDEKYLFAPGNGCRLVFVNSHFSPQLSNLEQLPPAVKVLSLSEALNSETELVQKHLARHADHYTHYFTAWNTASFRDGAFIHIPAGVVVEKPIELLYLSTGRTTPTVSHPRNLFLLGEQSQVTILEHYAGSRNETYLTNSVCEIVLADHAILDHYKIQRENHDAFHIGTLNVSQASGSRFRLHSIAMGASLSRNNLHVFLNGEGCDCGLRGLSVGQNRQLIDHYIRVDHNRPHCTSREYFKGIYDDEAHGVFSGRIYVSPNAPQTDAKQTNMNLLLSDKAHVNSKPQLEIFTDDVKCTHGATIGQLNRDSIFYLRSRGLSEKQARNLLVRAFASEITDTISIKELRDWLNDWLTKRLSKPQNLKDGNERY